MSTRFQLATSLVVLLAHCPARAADSPIHPEADRLLRETSARLSSAKTLTFKAEVWEDVMVAGHKVTTSKSVDVKLRHSDGIQIEVRSPSRSRGFWYNGHSLTLLDRVHGLYGSIPVPGTIDETIDAANDRFGIQFPLEDFLVSDPYMSAMEGVRGGAFFGKAKVLGTPCQHIAFGTDRIDWQLWVTDTSKPLPKKLVITYKSEPGQPQVTALFSDWNLKAGLSDATFAFSPPKGTSKIDVLPAEEPE